MTGAQIDQLREDATEAAIILDRLRVELDEDNYCAAKEKAKGLLLSILPKEEQERLERGSIKIEGKMGTYHISPYSQTHIQKKGKTIAYSCLQLTIPAPTYDRMIAEYLLLKNDEALYWKKANVFRKTSFNAKKTIAECFLIWVDAFLIANGIAWLINH